MKDPSTLFLPALLALSPACGPEAYFVKSGSYTADSTTPAQFMNLTMVVNAEQKTATLTPTGGQALSLTLGQEIVVERQ